jgi:hypothetical protein
MALHHFPKITTDGLVLCLDAGNPLSYPGSGTVWSDLSGNGNNGMLVNGPTFNSDNKGSIVFDGVDDFSRPNISHSYLNSSALEVIFNSSSHGGGNKTIFGYRHNGGYSLPTIGSIYLNNNTLSASVITASQVYRVATFATQISINQTYHVILNKDTVNGTLQLFVNGIAGNIQTFDAATYGQWTTAGSFIGANILDICKSSNTSAGQGWANDYFNGRIFKLGVYNRIITLSEIQQNYNATKGRYGL